MLDARPMPAAPSRAWTRSGAASAAAVIAEPATSGLRLESVALGSLAAACGARARVVRLTPELLEGAETWLPALVQGALGPAERADWERLPQSRRRRRQWLLGRVAAKEVVNSFVRDATGKVLHPAGIEIWADDSGAPMVSFRTRPVPIQAVLLSIAHTGNTAVALGAAVGTASDRVWGVGIDVESCRSRAAVERKGLTPTERGLLAGLLPAARHGLATRIWCAKEAAAKALGVGLDRLGGPQSIAVTPLNPDGDRLRVEIPGAPVGRSCVLDATAYRHGDLIVASVLDAKSEPGAV